MSILKNLHPQQIIPQQQAGTPQPPYNPDYQPGSENCGQDEVPFMSQIPGYPLVTIPLADENNGQDLPLPTLDSPPSSGVCRKNDSKDPEIKGFCFSDKNFRRRFIKKVYCTFIYQTLFTLGIILPFAINRKFKRVALKNYALAIFSMLSTLICCISMAYIEIFRRIPTLKFVSFVIFTISEGLSFGSLAARLTPCDVALTVGATAIIFFLLTCYGYRTKWDFTNLGKIITYASFVVCVLYFYGIEYNSDMIITRLFSDGYFPIFLSYLIIKFSFFYFYFFKAVTNKIV